MVEKLILDIYRAVYFELEVSFDLVDKSVDNWFLSYYLPQKRQDEIIESMLKNKKLTKLKKQMIKNSLYLGCLPRGQIMIQYKIELETWYQETPNETYKEYIGGIFESIEHALIFLNRDIEHILDEYPVTSLSIKPY